MAKSPKIIGREAADALQRWAYGKRVLGFTEVLTWNGPSEREAMFAMRGPTVKMENLMLRPDLIGNPGSMLDTSLQKAFGFSPVIDEWGQIRSEVGQLLDTHNSSLDALISAIEGVIAYFMGTQQAFMSIMPAEGSPWEPMQRETTFYNARTGKLGKTPKPHWIKRLTSYGIPEDSQRCDLIHKWGMLGAELCHLAPVLPRPPGRAMALVTSGNEFFLATHNLGSGDLKADLKAWKSSARHINACGGILFPSIAVGPIPALTFGMITLVINPDVVFSGLKPYTGKTITSPVTVYSTDAWTETHRSFEGYVSNLLAEQLTGHWNGDGPRHFYILGLPVKTNSPSEASHVSSTRGLDDVLARKSRAWHPGLTYAEVGKLRERGKDDAYLYAEAKVNGVLPVEAITACAVPSPFEKEAESFLQAIHCHAPLIVVPSTKRELKLIANGDMRESFDALYALGWRTREAILEEAQTPLYSGEHDWEYRYVSMRYR